MTEDVASQGSKIRQRRLQLGFTQDDLAERADVSQSMVSRAENDDPIHEESLAKILATLAALTKSAPGETPRKKVPARGTAAVSSTPATNLLEMVLTRALAPARGHTLSDAVNVQRALEEAPGTGPGEVAAEALQSAAVQWLDTAVELRRRNIPVTTASLLMWVTAGPIVSASAATKTAPARASTTSAQDDFGEQAVGSDIRAKFTG